MYPPEPQRESLPAVTAAGVVAVIFASVGVLGSGLVLLVFLLIPNLPNSSGGAAVPENERASIIGIYAFFFAICVGELVIAINVLRKKNWARIAILVWAGIMAFFAAMIAIGVFFALNFMPQTGPAQKDPQVLLFMKFFMLVLCGIPFAVAVWWLLLFTRPRVAVAFQHGVQPNTVPMYGTTLPALQLQASPPPSVKPSCPVALLIVAVLLLCSAVTTPLFLLMRTNHSVPLFFFGLTTSAASGRIFMASLSVLYGVLAIGLIRLKPVSLDILVALHALFLINGISSFLSPNFVHAVHEALQHASSSGANLPQGFSEGIFRIAQIVGIVFSQIVIGVLIGFRSRFQKVAGAAQNFV